MQEIYEKIENFLAENLNGVIVVVGPTASGKTRLSIEIAKYISSEKKWGDAEIINADSRQLYMDMPIITAAPTAEEKGDVPHHLFEFLSPEKTLNVMEWRDLAEKKIEEIQARGNVPLICGGTGLFVNALTKNFSISVPPNLEFREKMQQFSGEELWKMLNEKDTKEAQKIPAGNKKYLIRALEICEADGEKTISANVQEPKFPFLLFGSTYPRKKLYERINDRNQIMFDDGLLDEAIALLQKYPYVPNSDGAFTFHGLPEIIKLFNGEMTEEQMRETMKKNTRNYAKRQLTWWKKDERVTWRNGETGEIGIDIRGEGY